MPSRIRILIAATGLVLAMGGCDRGWVEFQKIELGQPLPKQSLLRSVPTGSNTDQAATDTELVKSFVWDNCGVWPVPLSLGMHWIVAQTDNEERITAKVYHAQAWSNYALLTAVAVRHVMELQVPSRLLVKPAAKTVFDGIERDLERSRTLRNYLIEAVGKISPEDEWYSSDKPPPFLMPQAAGVNLLTFASVASGFGGLMWSIEHLPLEGIEQEGYDRTFRPVPCGSIRLRNVGRQHIRIEMNLFRLFDPLGLAAYLYIPTEYPEDKTIRKCSASQVIWTLPQAGD